LGQFGKVLSWVVIGAFTISLAPTIAARTASAVFFSPELVADTLQQGLVENGSLRQSVLRQLLASTAGEEDDLLPQMTAELSDEDWQRISEIALPNTWIEEQLQSLVSSMYGWLETDELAPDLSLNIEPVKRNLVGDGSQEIVEIIVASWHDCSLQDALAFEEAFRQGSELPFFMCQLPEPFNSIILARMTEEFQSQARNVPSDLDLINGSGSVDFNRLLEMKSSLRQLRFFARWLILVPLSMLGLLMALRVRSLWDWARWWGIPLLAGGVLTVGLALLLAFSLPGQLSGAAQSFELPALLVLSARSILTGLGEKLIWRTAVWGAVLAAVGGLLLVISLILNNPNQATIALSRNRSVQ
jgi:hypothetical protein